ncbi:MAG: serine/threonine-protein kinase [Polyangiales bacterium]
MSETISAADGRYLLHQVVIEAPATELWRAELVCAAGIRRPVAFKRLRAPFARDPAYREAMTREARVLLLLDHPNVAQLVDFGEDAAGLYLVTEWAWGLTLQDIIQLAEAHQRRPSPVVLGAVGVQILLAFDAAHRRVVRGPHGVTAAPVVQRDLSPSGVLLTVRGSVKLTDFGLPRPFTPAALETLGAGDPRVSYVAPELALGQRPSVASDLYACGALLWECIAGRRVWSGVGVEHAMTLLRNGHRAPRLRDVRPDVPPAIAGVVDCALSANPAERYDSATTFARALEDALRSIPERVDTPRLAWEVSTALQLRQRMIESMRPPAHPSGSPSAPAPVFYEDDSETRRTAVFMPAAVDPRQSLIPVEIEESTSIVPPIAEVPTGARVRRDSVEVALADAPGAEQKVDDEILNSDKPPPSPSSPAVPAVPSKPPAPSTPSTPAAPAQS